jgi:hypothetical protein
MQALEDQDLFRPEYNRRVKRPGAMVIDRFLDGHATPEHDEVLFELVDPVCLRVECSQPLPPAPLAVKAMVIVKRDGGDKVGPEDIPHTLRKRGLSRPAVAGDPQGKDIGRCRDGVLEVRAVHALSRCCRVSGKNYTAAAETGEKTGQPYRHALRPTGSGLREYDSNGWQ